MLFLAALALFCIQVQALFYHTAYQNTTWDDANWSLISQIPDPGHYQSRAHLSNGYIGIGLSSLGPFFEVESSVGGDNIYGWPLFDRRQTFSTVAGFYGSVPGFTAGMTNFEWLNELGNEDVISGIPHWSGLEIEYQGHFLNASTNTSEIGWYEATWNYRNATLSWSYIWTPSDGTSFFITYTMFVHKLYVNQAAVQLTIETRDAANVTVYDVLNGDGAARSVSVGTGFEAANSTVWSAVHPVNVSTDAAYIYAKTLVNGSFGNYPRSISNDVSKAGSNASSIAQGISISLQARTITTVEKFIGIASADTFRDPQIVARNASMAAAGVGFQSLLTSHVQEWQSIFTPDSIDSYRLPNGSLPTDQNIIDQQIMAVTNSYGMVQNTIGLNATAAVTVAYGNAYNNNLANNSIAVCGLGSSCYAGLIFWDAENWMSPGLVVAYPQAAKQIANYRVSKFDQAQRNINDAFLSSQANTSFAATSAIFPWTSGRSGRCSGVGPCFDYEYHINGDVSLELENLCYVTGDTASFRNDYFPIYDAVAQVYSDLLQFNGSTGQYSFLNATDPDEWANHIDNPGYTNVLIKTVLEHANGFRNQFGLSTSATWARQAANIVIPTDPDININLEYSGMNGSVSVKQADVVLIDDFLDYQNPYTLSDLDYYAGKQSANGPGMTYGVFSIVASEESPSGCSAYTYDLYGSVPYARGPWYQYSEQLNDNYTLNGGTHPAFPFLTGMGGASRVSIFGYLGLRLRQTDLNISPTLPPQIPYLTYRTIYWQGHAISASANQTHTTLTRLNQTTPGYNPIYLEYPYTTNTNIFNTSNTTNSPLPIPITLSFSPLIHNLTFATPLVIPNRRPDLNLTVPNNLAQCRPLVTSSAPHLPGRFPLAAIDGAVSTAWQPVSNASASITVDLGVGAEGVRIVGFAFDWAQAPPESYSIAFSNSSSSSSSSAQSGNAPDAERVVSSGNITISAPYDALNAAALVRYQSNTTEVTLLAPVLGGRYATLSIEGSWAGDGRGASVAEWAVIKQEEDGGGSAGKRKRRVEMRRYFSG